MKILLKNKVFINKYNAKNCYLYARNVERVF